ncbi:MAG: MlaD family protein [Planctomycetota bacterium]|jgi:ABC-type transporter Mla subunit MlaD
MRHQKNHLFLGIFVIAGIVLIGGVITLLGAQTAFRRGIAMESYFKEPVTGLDAGSPVRFRGVQIGKVTEITTTGAAYGRNDYNYALVRVEVYPELLGIPATEGFPEYAAARIKQGLRVQLAETNLTGTAHIEAVYLKHPEPADALPFDWEPLFPYVPAATSTLETFKVSVEAVLEKLKTADIVGVIEAAKSTFGRVDQALMDADVAGLSNKAQQTLESMQAELVQLGNRARTTLQRAEDTIGDVDRLLAKPELERAIVRLDALTADVDEAMVDFRKLVHRSNQTMGKVQNAVHGRGRDIAAIADGLRELVDNLNSLSGMLERHPSLFVFGKPPQEAKKTPTLQQPNDKEPGK